VTGFLGEVSDQYSQIFLSFTFSGNLNVNEVNTSGLSSLDLALPCCFMRSFSTIEPVQKDDPKKTGAPSLVRRAVSGLNKVAGQPVTGHCSI